jgi:hypothetical protein
MFFSRQEQVITGFLGLLDQLAVFEFVPADLSSERNFMSGKAAR